MNSKFYKAFDSHCRAKSFEPSTTPAFYRMDRGVITSDIYRPRSKQGDLSISGMRKCRQSGL